MYVQHDEDHSYLVFEDSQHIDKCVLTEAINVLEYIAEYTLETTDTIDSILFDDNNDVIIEKTEDDAILVTVKTVTFTFDSVNDAVEFCLVLTKSKISEVSNESE